MVMTRIFRRREKEEGRKEGRREGRRETENEFIEADAQRRPDETLQQAVERLRSKKTESK